MLNLFRIYFVHPWFLLLLFAVPLVLWRHLRRPHAALRYPDMGLLAQLPPGRGPAARWGSAVLRGIALTCLVLAVSGLRWPDQTTRISTEGIAIQIVVDVSGSMAEQDFDWRGERISRLEAVKRAFRLFVAGGDGPDNEHLDGRGDDLIGLVTFARRPDPACPLTMSHSVFLHMLDAEKPRPGTANESETNLTDAIILALQRLRPARPERKVMVLLSDGEHNVVDTASEDVRTPRQAAQLAANLHVPIYTIDAGGEPAGELERLTRPEMAVNRENGIRALREIAKITGGQYFQARDTKTLLDVCRKIDGLEKTEIETFQFRDSYEAYVILGLVSFVLLIAVHGLELTVWRRLP